jgi:hypothetical protein
MKQSICFQNKLNTSRKSLKKLKRLHLKIHKNLKRISIHPIMIQEIQILKKNL